MRIAGLLVLVAVTPAVAEPGDEVILDTSPLTLHARTDGQDVAARLLAAPDGPYLRLDAMARPSVVALGAKERTVRQAWAVGDRIVLSSENVAWKSDPDLDITSRGYRANATLSVNLGAGIRLDVGAGKGRVDSRYASGRYDEKSIALTKTKQLSRGRILWLALTLAQRTWVEPAPPGESDGTQLSVSVGGTF